MAKVTGGAKARKFLQEARKAQKRQVQRTEVGWFPDARYPDGTPVATVAMHHEFGSATHEERMVLRRAGRLSEDDVKQILRRGINPRTMVVDKPLADRAGGAVKRQIQRGILEEKLIESGRHVPVGGHPARRRVMAPPGGRGGRVAVRGFRRRARVTLRA